MIMQYQDCLFNRLEKLERDNTILKNKVRKMKEMLREKEDELVMIQ